MWHGCWGTLQMCKINNTVLTTKNKRGKNALCTYTALLFTVYEQLAEKLTFFCNFVQVSYTAQYRASTSPNPFHVGSLCELSFY